MTTTTKPHGSNTVTAYARNSAGEKVETTFYSFATNEISQYGRACEEIEKAHGFRPDINAVSIRVL